MINLASSAALSSTSLLTAAVPTTSAFSTPEVFLASAAMIGDQNIVSLFLEAGLIAKLVFAVLIFFSLGSWAVMFNKWRQFKRVSRDNARFLNTFRQSARFSEINSVTQQYAASPLVGLFQAGYIEIDAQGKAQQSPQSPNETQAIAYRIKSLEGVERSLK